jgi:hypothetical protein
MLPVDHASQDDASLQVLQALCETAAAAAAGGQHGQSDNVASEGVIHVGNGPVAGSVGICEGSIFQSATGFRCKHVYKHTVKGEQTCSLQMSQHLGTPAATYLRHAAQGAIHR